jgi:hypothetical protein
MTLPTISMLMFLRYHYILAHQERIHRDLETAALLHTILPICSAKVEM